MRCGLIDIGNRNRFRMKATRLFFLVFPLFFSCGLSAQNKHTIRIGAGATYDHCKYLYGVHVQDAEGQSVLKHMRHSASNSNQYSFFNF